MSDRKLAARMAAREVNKLVEEFVLKSPAFEGDSEIVSRLGLAMGNLFVALDITEPLVSEDDLRNIIKKGEPS